MTTHTVSPASYDRVMRIVHWLTLALVAAAFAAVWIDDPEIVGSYVNPVLQIHRSLGLTVAALTVFRLVWRWRVRVPDLPEDMRAVEKLAARTVEGLIYLLLVAQPLVGLLYTNAYGLRAKPFFLFEIPALIAKNKPLGIQLGGIHSFLAYALLSLIGLHAAAALFHHFIRRDDVLNAMLPPRLRR